MLIKVHLAHLALAAAETGRAEGKMDFAPPAGHVPSEAEKDAILCTSNPEKASSYFSENMRLETIDLALKEENARLEICMGELKSYLLEFAKHQELVRCSSLDDPTMLETHTGYPSLIFNYLDCTEQICTVLSRLSRIYFALICKWGAAKAKLDHINGTSSTVYSDLDGTGSTVYSDLDGTGSTVHSGPGDVPSMYSDPDFHTLSIENSLLKSRAISMRNRDLCGIIVDTANQSEIHSGNLLELIGDVNASVWRSLDSGLLEAKFNEIERHLKGCAGKSEASLHLKRL